MSTFLYGLATGVVLTCVAWIALAFSEAVRDRDLDLDGEDM